MAQPGSNTVISNVTPCGLGLTVCVGGGAGGMLGKGRNRGGLGAPAGHQEEQVLAWGWWSGALDRPLRKPDGNVHAFTATRGQQRVSSGAPGRGQEACTPGFLLGSAWQPLTWLGVLKSQRPPTGSRHSGALSNPSQPCRPPWAQGRTQLAPLPPPLSCLMWAV